MTESELFLLNFDNFCIKWLSHLIFNKDLGKGEEIMAVRCLLCGLTQNAAPFVAQAFRQLPKGRRYDLPQEILEKLKPFQDQHGNIYLTKHQAYTQLATKGVFTNAQLELIFEAINKIRP